MVDGRQADAGPQGVLNGHPLAEERVHHGSTTGDQRGLAEVGEKTQDGMKAFECAGRPETEVDALAEFGQENQVQDDGAEKDFWKWRNTVFRGSGSSSYEASSESSQVLWTAMVLLPPMEISDANSSIARLLSPTFGTYLITTWANRVLH